jgi:hypothetical protein
MLLTSFTGLWTEFAAWHLPIVATPKREHGLGTTFEEHVPLRECSAYLLTARCRYSCSRFLLSVASDRIYT